MKLLFVDVDGVLNHEETQGWEHGHWNVLDDACIARLKSIVARTGTKLVLSSTWRASEEGVAALVMKGLEFVGRTPVAWGRKPRKDEILKWLQEVYPNSLGWNNTIIQKLAVVDDDVDADLGDGSFFKTYFTHGGLTDEVKERIIEYLGEIK